MSTRRQIYPLGWQLEEAIADSTEAWLKAYGTREDNGNGQWLAISTVNLSVDLFAGGYGVATVTIRSKRKWNDQTYVFRLARRGESDWVRQGDSLP